jgi:hypothetical protein
MKKRLAWFFALIGWFTIIAQLVLMIQNRVMDIPETIIRFFSFFTILTNILVAVYFTLQVIKPSARLLHTPGNLTALTIYITVVGLVYQLLLRHVWTPTGLQMVVDELLHSVIPVLAIIYWYLFEKKAAVQYKQSGKWLIYPLIYLVYILLRGKAAGFYPYPFVNVTELGLQKVLINSAFLLVFFILLSVAFIKAGKMVAKK